LPSLGQWVAMNLVKGGSFCGWGARRCSVPTKVRRESTGSDLLGEETEGPWCPEKKRVEKRPGSRPSFKNPLQKLRTQG